MMIAKSRLSVIAIACLACAVVDMFNAQNSAIVTGRATTINLTNPNDPVTTPNLPYDANGNVLPNRSLPKNAGVGAANAYPNPRSIEAQVRFSF